MTDIPVLLLRRTYFEDATIGLMWVEGKQNPVWPTLELPDKNNQVNVSCIPEGEYLFKPLHSKCRIYYPDIWQAKEVKGRTGIQIHVANRTEQLLGCIAPGLSFGYMKYQKIHSDLGKAVFSSASALSEIKRTIGYVPFKLRIWS